MDSHKIKSLWLISENITQSIQKYITIDDQLGFIIPLILAPRAATFSQITPTADAYSIQ